MPPISLRAREESSEIWLLIKEWSDATEGERVLLVSPKPIRMNGDGAQPKWRGCSVLDSQSWGEPKQQLAVLQSHSALKELNVRGKGGDGTGGKRP